MPYYVYAWIGSFSAAFIVITTKLTGKYAIKNNWLFNFIWAIISLIFIIPPAVVNHAGMPKDWLPIIMAGVFGALWNIFYILSLYLMDISTLSPLFSFRTIFAVLLGVMFLKENLSINQLMIVVLVIVMGIFATMDEKFSPKSFFKSSIGIAILAMFFLALNNSFIKLSLINNDLWTTNLWTILISCLALLPTLPWFYKDLRLVRLKQVLPVMAMGVFQTITSVTANIAYGVNVGVAAVIMSIPFSLILVIPLSFISPKLLEKHSVKVYALRLIASSVMIYGALQLSR